MHRRPPAALLVLALAAPLLAAPLLVGCNTRRPGEPESARIEAFLGGPRGYGLISGGRPTQSHEAYRIKPYAEAGDEGKPGIAGHPILSGPVPMDDASVREMSLILRDENTYLWDTAKACEFMPGVALRWKGKENTVDVLLCFSCDELTVYLDGKHVDSEDFDPRRADLVAICKRLFPGDPKIQEL